MFGVSQTGTGGSGGGGSFRLRSRKLIKNEVPKPNELVEQDEVVDCAKDADLGHSENRLRASGELSPGG